MSTAAEPRRESVFRVDDLVVDCARHTVTRDGAELPLPRLTFSLFEALIRAAPAVVTLDDLMTHVWGEVVVSEETLTQRISLLRQALGDDSKSPRYVRSVRGVGYGLVPEVEVQTGSAPGRAAKFAGLFGYLAVGLAVGALALAYWLSTRHDDAATGTRLSVAVLPFADMSPDRDQGYFVDGMHDEIISRLTDLDAFSVISRTSVMPYRDSQKSLGEIGAELKADVILEGSVRRAGDVVRITAQLLDARTDSHYFSESYERPLTVDNLFAIQSDVAVSVARQFNATLGPSADEALAHLPTQSLEAYNLLLLGRYHLRRISPENLRKAVDFFLAAIEEDAGLVEAYVGLARSYTFIGTGYGWMPPDAAYNLAEAATLKALELAPASALVQGLYGDILTWYRWDWAGAEAAYLRARELDPDNGGLGYLILLSIQQRTEETIALAKELEQRYPLDPWVLTNLGWRYLELGMPEEAIARADAALDIEGDNSDAYAVRGLAAMQLGDSEAAIADLERNAELHSGSPQSRTMLAATYIRAGQLGRARAILDELEAEALQAYVAGDRIAAIHALLGNEDEALRWLDIAYRQRSRGLIFLNVDRVWDSLRGHPEFQDLLRRVGLANPAES